jgi:DNA polymerase delta subunit 1
MYFNPIVVCDFVSLYPSIMIAFNLSYETLLVKGRDDQMKYSISDDQIQDVELVPGQSPLLFMKPAEGMGILPTLLTNLLNARKKAKLEMKAATDPTMKQILNGRQLALKVSCNSIYGFCGAVRGGFLPCVPIAAAVTSIGRKLIDHTKDTICAHFTKANGYVSDSRVVYGDTGMFLSSQVMQRIDEM